MKISDHIRNSLRAADERDLNQAMLSACIAVDGTAKKTYANIPEVGKRFRQFIYDNIDVIELMFGGINLETTQFPVRSNKGKLGIGFADVVYEKYRCSMAHGDELPPGYKLELKIAEGVHTFGVDLENEVMTFPESVIFALGLACVLAPVNSDQLIGDTRYFFKDNVNTFVVDRWWGNLSCAKKIMNLDTRLRVTINF